MKRQLDCGRLGFAACFAFAIAAPLHAFEPLDWVAPISGLSQGSTADRESGWHVTEGLGATSRFEKTLGLGKTGGVSQNPVVAAVPGRLAARQQPPADIVGPRQIALMNQLRRPMSEIRIERGAADLPMQRDIAPVDRLHPPVPPNVAAKWFDDARPVVVMATDAPMPGPNRHVVGYWHRPTYFQELNLERCGRTLGCAQNAVSAVHFLTNTALLPYRLASQPPDLPVASRGDCAVGQAYPTDIEPLGCSARGALSEAAAAAGFVFLLL